MTLNIYVDRAIYFLNNNTLMFTLVRVKEILWAFRITILSFNCNCFRLRKKSGNSYKVILNITKHLFLIAISRYGIPYINLTYVGT